MHHILTAFALYSLASVSPTSMACHIVLRLETAPSDTQRAFGIKGQPRQTPGALLSKFTLYASNLTTACWQYSVLHDLHIFLNFFLESFLRSTQRRPLNLLQQPVYPDRSMYVLIQELSTTTSDHQPQYQVLVCRCLDLFLGSTAVVHPELSTCIVSFWVLFCQIFDVLSRLVITTRSCTLCTRVGKPRVNFNNST